MIIICPKCEKKFELDSNLIPENGRTLQCGSCNEVWFFNPSIQQSITKTKPEITIEDNIKSNVNKLEEKIEKWDGMGIGAKLRKLLKLGI